MAKLKIPADAAKALTVPDHLPLLCVANGNGWCPLDYGGFQKETGTSFTLVPYRGVSPT
jgi:hypothetical protein